MAKRTTFVERTAISLLSSEKAAFLAPRFLSSAPTAASLALHSPH